MQWIVMVVGPTETPDVFGPYQRRETAEMDAERWNDANPDDSTEPWKAFAFPLRRGNDLNGS